MNDQGGAGEPVAYALVTAEALPGMADLCRACYGERAEPEEWWRWRFFSGGPNAALVAVGVHGEVLVGMQPVRIEAFLQKGRSVLGAVLEGAMVRPGWRGRGVFSRLVSSALDGAWARGAAFAYSMPNERSYPAFLKAGWWDLGERSVLVRPLLLGSVGGRTKSGNVGIRATPVPRFGDGWPELMARHGRPGEVQPARDAPWLEWRYASNPATRYTLVEARGPDGCLLGTAVGRVLRVAALRVGVVVESAGEGAGLRAALRGVEDGFRREGALLALSVVSAASQVTALSGCGYWQIPGFLPRRRFRTVCRPRPDAEPAGLPPRGVEDWRLSLGDWDGI